MFIDLKKISQIQNSVLIALKDGPTNLPLKVGEYLMNNQVKNEIQDFTFYLAGGRVDHYCRILYHFEAPSWKLELARFLA